jgi:hypothetical protein
MFRTLSRRLGAAALVLTVAATGAVLTQAPASADECASAGGNGVCIGTWTFLFKPSVGGVEVLPQQTIGGGSLTLPGATTPPVVSPVPAVYAPFSICYVLGCIPSGSAIPGTGQSILVPATTVGGQTIPIPFLYTTPPIGTPPVGVEQPITLPVTPEYQTVSWALCVASILHPGMYIWQELTQGHLENALTEAYAWCGQPLS